jgi:hypothetical protein
MHSRWQDIIAMQHFFDDEPMQRVQPTTRETASR